MPSIDELYARYRKGLITRHVCLNGRVDENTWLGQVPLGDPWSGDGGTPGWIAPNMRQGMEGYRAIDTEQIHSAEFAWVPLYQYGPSTTAWALSLEEETPLLTRGGWDAVGPGVLVPGSSWGGGDNPLLTTGLALAVFSIESLDGVTDEASLRYADLLFSYIEGCEHKGSGFFLRCPTYTHRSGCAATDDVCGSKWASTDEMLGVALGCYYYWEAKKEAGESVSRVEALVGRWARTMDRHGYWLLPDSAVFGEVADVHDLPDLGKQQAWIFAFVFRRLFETIAGVMPSPHWNDDEWSFYFGEPRHYDTVEVLSIVARYTLFLPVQILVQLVDWLEDVWDWIFGSDDEDLSADEIWNLIQSTGLYETKWGMLADVVEAKIEDLYGHVDTGQFFRALWDNIEGVATEDHPLISWLLAAVEAGMTAAATALLPAELGVGVGLAIGESLASWLEEAIYSQVDSVETFNFQMLAFYAHLGTELDETALNRERAARGLHALLSRNDVHCLGNAYLYTVYARIYDRYCAAGGAPWAQSAKLDEAIKHLTQADEWQHDLPLGQICDLNALYADWNHQFYTKKDAKGRNITAEVTEAFARHGGSDWYATWKEWAFPSTYNPHYLIGENRTWEHKPDSHVYTGRDGWLFHRAVNTEGPGVDAYARALFGEGRDLRLEGCGLGLLFPVALRRFWNQSAKLAIEDALYPVLPYLGAGGPQLEWRMDFQRGPSASTLSEVRYLLLDSFKAGDELFMPKHQRLWLVTEEGWMAWMGRRREWERPDQARTRTRCDLEGEDNRDLSSEQFHQPRYMKPVPNWKRYKATDWAWWCKSWRDLYRFRGRRNYSSFAQTRVLRRSLLAIGEWECIVEASNDYTALSEHASVWRADATIGSTDGRPLLVTSPALTVADAGWSFETLTTPLREYFDPAQPLVHMRLKVRPVVHRLGGEGCSPTGILCGPALTICDCIGPEVFEIQGLRYALNIRSLVVHDLMYGHHDHIRKAARGYRLVPLPIDPAVDLQGRLPAEWLALLAAATKAPAGYWEDLAEAVRRRDYVLAWSGWKAGRLARPYELMPQERMRVYLEDHPGRKRDYDAKNRQRLRLCSYCFSSRPDYPAPH